MTNISDLQSHLDHWQPRFRSLAAWTISIASDSHQVAGATINADTMGQTCERALAVKPCHIERDEAATEGASNWCRTHEVYVSDIAIRCGALVDIERTRGVFRALDIAVTALKRSPCSASDGDIHCRRCAALKQLGESTDKVA